MRKSTTPTDLKDDTIPKFVYDLKSRKLIPWNGEKIFNCSWHHTVKQQILERNPELRKFLKLICFPPINHCIDTIDGKKGDIHSEADAKHSRFFERWGIKLSEVIYLD